MNPIKSKPSHGWLAITALITAALVFFTFSMDASANAPLLQTPGEGQTIFEAKCQSCHTIGAGRLVGPDLEGVTARRERDWLVRFITEPDRVIAEGDPIAVQLLQENNQVPMPNLGLSQQEVEAVIAFLAEGPAPGGQPAATLSGGSPQLGEALFTGAQPLANDGVACIACHSVAGVSAFGGGSLGPDLTHVVQRYGEPGLSAALQGLPFPTMQGVFTQRPLTPGEQAALFAYFKQSDTGVAGSQVSDPVWFWGAGALGAGLLFGGMLVFWPRQRRSLSERLRDAR